MTTKIKLSSLGHAAPSFFAPILLFALSVMASYVFPSANNRSLPLLPSILIPQKTEQKPVIKKKSKSTIKSIPTIIKPDSVKQKKDTVTIPEFQSPEFPGGITELKEFICNNFKYPKEAIEHKIEGRSGVYFSVNPNGKIADCKLYQAVGSGCDEELLRVLRMTPLWKPKIINYKTVNSDFDIKVNFHEQGTKLERIDLDIEEELPLVEGSEQNPEFPGGLDNLLKYLKNHVRYKIEAQKLKLHGTVFVQFVVSKTGKITKTKILRGIGNPCDDEAIKIVSTMPDWIPGRYNGQPVDVMFQIPIRFEIPK
ncbi:MAG: energy transducer TonB [Bacteroidetes bacterium]|nr:energy transducer TonB [Bacteroidota bacterium]